uniref:hypothetical protein n=1 Tax=Methylobacterium sp. B34 TaxID=95563 RepID=UPI00034AA76A|nr:hypothetical protein [Methylobacterium sp. B34]
MTTSPRYRSGFEKQIADNTVSATPVDYEAVTLSYVITHRYKPDFIIRGANGIIYVEAKGWFKPSDRTKLLAVRAANPDADIRLLFQRPHNRLTSKSTTTYAAWAEKHGFPWAAGAEIPAEWLS